VIELGPLVDELAVLLEPDLDAKRLNLRSAAASSAWVWADRELLRQALFNLIHNAIQFAPSQGLVEIAVVRGENGSCRIDVADRGPGVAPEKTESLFTPYFSTRPDGTGLGLAMVRRIAASHGWEAGYTPRPGGGAIFWLDGIHA
jgi:signal transduction histidine kinase